MQEKKSHNTKKTLQFIYVEKEFTIAPTMTNEKENIFT